MSTRGLRAKEKLALARARDDANLVVTKRQRPISTLSIVERSKELKTASGAHTKSLKQILAKDPPPSNRTFAKAKPAAKAAIPTALRPSADSAVNDAIVLRAVNQAMAPFMMQLVQLKNLNLRVR